MTTVIKDGMVSKLDLILKLTSSIGVGSKRIVRRCNGFTPIITIGFSPITFTGSRIPTGRI